MDFNSSFLECTVSGSLKLGEAIQATAVNASLAEPSAKETNIEALFMSASPTNGCVVGKVCLVAGVQTTGQNGVKRRAVVIKDATRAAKLILWEALADVVSWNLSC
jgi:hypothetical protein